MSKTKSLHHIVFATKQREMTITEADKKELYAYILGIIRNLKCYLIRINGMPDHIHLLVDVNPTVAIADLVKQIKQSSSYWMKSSGKFPKFRCWGEGYYAFSIAVSELDKVKAYIINQEAHHAGNNLVDEMKFLADKYMVAWHPNDWE